MIKAIIKIKTIKIAIRKHIIKGEREICDK